VKASLREFQLLQLMKKVSGFSSKYLFFPPSKLVYRNVLQPMPQREDTLAAIKGALWRSKSHLIAGK
jgi:hypothetical protein